MSSILDLVKAPHTFGTGIAGDIMGFLGLPQLADSVYGADKNANNLIKSWTHSGMTDEQKEQNAWTSEREDTVNQRAVADLTAAGLNPALMYGSGSQASPSSPSSTGSSAGVSMSDMLELSTLPARMAVMEAQANDLNASAYLKRSNENLNQQNYEFNETFNKLLIEGKQNSNRLTSEQVKEITLKCNKIAEEIKEVIARTENEQEKKSLIQAEAWFRRANANQIDELTPVLKLYTEAQTAKEKAMAGWYTVQQSVQNKLIDEGYYDEMIAELKARATSEESRAAIDELDRKIRTGKLYTSDVSGFLGKVDQAFGDYFINIPAALVTNIISYGGSLLTGIAGFALGKGALSKTGSTVQTLSGREADAWSPLIQGTRF